MKLVTRFLVSLVSSCNVILANNIDFYTLLGLPRNAHLSPEDIKQAYHKKLLETHPDKVIGRRKNGDPTSPSDIEQDARPDIALLKDAFATILDPILRRQYDAVLKGKVGPRPAEVVSLDDFSMNPATDSRPYDTFSYPCRCGNVYLITEEQLEKDIHLIGCEACSEVVWVGYEEATEEEGQVVLGQ